LFVLREYKSELGWSRGRGRGKGRENLKQAPHPAWNLIRAQSYDPEIMT